MENGKKEMMVFSIFFIWLRMVCLSIYSFGSSLCGFPRCISSDAEHNWFLCLIKSDNESNLLPSNSVKLNLSELNSRLKWAEKSRLSQEAFEQA